VRCRTVPTKPRFVRGGEIGQRCAQYEGDAGSAKQMHVPALHFERTVSLWKPIRNARIRVAPVKPLRIVSTAARIAKAKRRLPTWSAVAVTPGAEPAPAQPRGKWDCHPSTGGSHVADGWQCYFFREFETNLRRWAMIYCFGSYGMGDVRVPRW